LQLSVCEGVEPYMPNRLKQAFGNLAITALVMGFALSIFDVAGPFIAADYYRLIFWGLVVLSVLILAIGLWRVKIGIQNGSLLVDDPEDW
jgi:uncharacterized membrane protein YqjE